MPGDGGSEKTADAASALAGRLRARSAEIEARILERLSGLYELSPGARTEMIAGAQVSVRDALAFSISAFEGGESWSEQIPDSYAETARYAARVGLPLEDVLLGYSAGNTAISEFVVEEVQQLMDSGLLQVGVDVQSRVSEALISGLSVAYASEVAKLETSASARVEREVESLLTDENAREPDVDYRLDRWHVGAIVTGSGAKRAAEVIAAELGCELLLIRRSAETDWAWWGSARPLPFSRLASAAKIPKGGVYIAVGEPLQGVEGFRRSHREAQLAAAVMIRTSERITRCVDVMLLAVLLEQPGAADLYLDAQIGPVRAHRDWPALRDALSGYLGANGNLASAAAAIGVDRHTVRRRLRRVEEILGMPIQERYAELDVALRLEELRGATLVRDAAAE